jgi:hypothetical protein
MQQRDEHEDFVRRSRSAPWEWKLDGWKFRPLGQAGNKHVKNPFGHADPGRRPLERQERRRVDRIWLRCYEKGQEGEADVTAVHRHRALVGPSVVTFTLIRCYNSLKRFAIHILRGISEPGYQNPFFLLIFARHLHAAFDRNSQPK